MSVIQTIRNKGWIMITSIGLVMIIFVIQSAFENGKRGGGIFSNTTTLGKVNGVTINKTEFDDEITFIEKMNGQQASSRDQLISGVWSQEVEKIINQQEYDKLGLVIGDKEFNEIMFDPNTSPLKREFTDSKTGEFKVAEAKTAFARIKKGKSVQDLELIEKVNKGYLEPLIQQSLSQKYAALLQAAAYAPKWLVEKMEADNAAVASITYVSVPYSSIVDSTVKLTEEDILAYAKKHHKQFDKDEESRTINYIGFSTTPSGADTADILKQITDLKADFAATQDAKAYLSKVGSELPYDNEQFTIKSKIKVPNADTIKQLKEGEIFGPYLDASNYTVAKMIKKRTLADSVFCRHILINTNGENAKPDSVAKKTIDSIVLAIQNGLDFRKAMEQFSDDKAATAAPDGGLMKYTSTEIQQKEKFDPDFAKFILFDGKKGERKIVKTKFGYHYIEITEQKNLDEALNVAYLSKPIIASNETVAAAQTAASQFAATSKNKKAFDENALKLNKQPLPSGEIKKMDFSVSSVGAGNDARKMVRWVYDANTGDISEPFEMNDKYVVAVVTNVNKIGLPSVATLRPLVEAQVRNEKKAKQIIDTKFKGATLEAIATNAATAVQRVDSILFSNPFIPSIGMELKVVGAAFNPSLKGKVSEAIAGNGGVFAVRVENIAIKPAASNANSVKHSILQAQKMAAYTSSPAALKKAATIKDNRAQFY
ncbi:MAG: SurA N-terminal domain-containing protein [Flavobacterium sp.]|nr:SurA N-terminal domain-containing protein [Flavobacterium sp.]